MELISLVAIFLLSMLVLVRSAEMVLTQSRTIGLALGLSPFMVGVLLVGMGTSLPELVSSIFGMLAGSTEIPTANATGSNITNILLIIGIGSIVARGVFATTKNLIDVELPLLVLSTSLFFGVAYDGLITTAESAFLVIGFVLYILYTALGEKDREEASRPKITARTITLFVLGLAALILSAKFLIDATLDIAPLVGISVGVITMVVIALGTSIPELMVTIAAARKGDSEVAIGNIFGSNAFNIMMVVGVPGLFGTMYLDEPTRTMAIPVMIMVTFFLLISGISKRIHVWEGLFFLLIYILFIGKVLGVL